jgi:hypothetical protein
LLEAELVEGGYQLPDGGEDGRLYREGVRERLIRWWAAWLESDQLAPTPETRESELPDISPAVLGFMALVLGVLLLAVLFRSVRSSDRDGKSSIKSATLVQEGKGGAAALQPADLRSRALELAEQELYEEATRALFLAALVDLDRCRAIDFRPEFSNGDYLGAFAGTAERRAVFGQAIRRFESHCYGTRECDRADFQQMLEITGALASSPEESLRANRRGPGSSQ